MAEIRAEEIKPGQMIKVDAEWVEIKSTHDIPGFKKNIEVRFARPISPALVEGRQHVTSMITTKESTWQIKSP